MTDVPHLDSPNDYKGDVVIVAPHTAALVDLPGFRNPQPGGNFAVGKDGLIKYPKAGEKLIREDEFEVFITCEDNGIKTLMATVKYKVKYELTLKAGIASTEGKVTLVSATKSGCPPRTAATAASPGAVIETVQPHPSSASTREE